MSRVRWCSQDSLCYSSQAWIQCSSLHNITSPPFHALLPFSLSVPSTRGSTACELPGRSMRNNPSISSSCLVWARNSLILGSSRGYSCPLRIRGQVLAMSVCQWPCLSPHAGPLTSSPLSSQQPGRTWGGGFSPQKPKLRASAVGKGRTCPRHSYMLKTREWEPARKKLLLLAPSERSSETGHNSDGLIWLQEAPA